MTFLKLHQYFVIWRLMTIRSTHVAFQSRYGAIIFIFTKFLRLFFFLIFLLILGSKTQIIGTYSIWQMILFYATFNLVDTVPQLFLREVYRFRHYIVSGDFDYFLVKPLSPLFRSLFGGSDILDLPLVITAIGLIIFAIANIGNISPISVVFYLLLIVNALAIAFSFHIFVLGLAILTTEIDHTIMIYRDLTQMGRIPVDLYLQPLRSLLTFAIPIGIMMTYPAKSLLGLLSVPFMLLSVLIAAVFLIFSLRFWHFALSRYSSASS